MNDYHNETENRFGMETVDDEADSPLRYFCRFTFGQFFTLLMLEVTTLIFVFYLGARYGNRYLRIGEVAERPNVVEVTAGNQALPSELAGDPELARLAREAIDANKGTPLKDRVEAIVAAQGGTPAPATSALPAEAVPPPLTGETPHVVEPTGEVALQSPSTTTPIQSSTPLLPPSAATDTTGSVETPTAAPATTGGALPYAIQVGSYQDLKEASYWVDEWRTKGYSAFMMIADLPDRGRWYRVRVGGFSSKTEADAFLSRLKGAMQTDAIVVLNEQ